MNLSKNSQTFLDYMENWLESRAVVSLEEALPEPEKSAIISADVINGFLYDGPLASPRVAAIGEPIARLMQAAWDRGLREILLVQDSHNEESPEFAAYGQHALKGSREAEAIDLIKALPFHGQIETVFKDSLHPAFNTGFDAWMERRKELDTFIAVGDVTDLCVYQLAMYLRLYANAHHIQRRVIVPANCVQTWHLSVADAENLPAMPHHGDLLHTTFLYHMALNDIQVVKEISV